MSRNKQLILIALAGAALGALFVSSARSQNSDAVDVTALARRVTALEAQVKEINAKLASIEVPKTPFNSEPLRRRKAVTEIGSFKTALQAFEIDCGRFPTSGEGLRSLVQQPQGVQNRKQGGYIDKIPADPWDHPYMYRCPGTHHPDGFDVYSMGPDGQDGGGDDIGNWDDK